MNLTPTQKAMALALDGRVSEGLALLEAAARDGLAEAMLLRGLWQLEGRFVSRDWAAARRSLSQAATAGHVGAARSLAGMIAAGIGGEADWNGALATLSDWADRDPLAARQIALIDAMSLDEAGRPTDYPNATPIRSDPRIDRVVGLLTGEECALLIDLAEPRLKPAMIFHEGQRQFVEDPVRRSHAAGFPVVSEWPFVRAINQRIAAATGTAIEQGEPLQVLRYHPGQEYRPHFDAVPGMANPRILTAIIWLNDDYAGGETWFEFGGIEQSPRTGDMLLFSNTLPDGTRDIRSRHSGTLVHEGVKYIASRWIRARPADAGEFGRHEAEQANR